MWPSISFVILGMSELEGKLNEAEHLIVNTARDQVEHEARAVLRRSFKYVPVDTGALRRSGYVSLTRPSTWRVGFDTHYAMKVHEDPFARHAAPTQWKYLERAYNEQLPGLRERVEVRMRILRRLGT